MEEETKKSSSMVTLFILAIIIIALLGIIISYLLKLQTEKENNISSDDYNKVEIINNINNNSVNANNNIVSNNIHNDNNKENNTTSEIKKEETNIKGYKYSETEKKDIQETIQNYYKLLAAKEIAASLMLTDVLELTVEGVQDPEYAPENYVEHPEPSKYMWTGIEYDEFRNLIWYISDDILKSNFKEFVEYKDYLYINEDMDHSNKFNYKITKQEIDNKSTKDTCISNVTVKNSKTGKSFSNTITMSRGNGDFVITSVK